MPYSILSPRRLTRALRRLSELAAADHVTIEVALCHGAVITVVYAAAANATPTARRVVESSARAAALVRQVSLEQRLPADWLEEDVKFYLALSAARSQPHLHDLGPNLILSVSEPAHLLAMKLYACHASVPPAAADHGDLAFLIERMGLASVEAVEHAYARFFPEHSLAEDVRSLVTRLLPTPA